MVTLISHKDCSQLWTNQIKRLWQVQADLRTFNLFLMSNNFKFGWTKTWRTYFGKIYLHPTLLFCQKITHFHKNRGFYLTLLFSSLEELKQFTKAIIDILGTTNSTATSFLCRCFRRKHHLKSVTKVALKEDKIDYFNESEINNELKSKSLIQKQKKQEPTKKYTQRIHCMHIWRSWHGVIFVLGLIQEHGISRQEKGLY